MTATDEQTAAAFLADIIAHPADDAPRLIFADWLEEHGQPERAEFIRVQVSLGNLDREAAVRHHSLECAFRNPSPKDCLQCRFGDLIDREYELLGTNSGIAWKLPYVDYYRSGASVGSLPESVHLALCRWAKDMGSLPIPEAAERFVEYSLSRGFVSGISCAAAFFLQHANALTACQPIQQVTLTTHPFGVLENRNNRDKYDVYFEGMFGRLQVEKEFARKWPQIEFVYPRGRFAGAAVQE